MNLRSAILAWSLGLVASAPGAESELARVERDYLAQRDAAVRPLLSAFADKLRSLHLSPVQRRDPRAAFLVESGRAATVPDLPAPGDSFSTTVIWWILPVNSLSPSWSSSAARPRFSGSAIWVAARRSASRCSARRACR